MTPQPPIAAAVVLGLLNHVYFNRFEPQNVNVSFLAIIVQPLALTLAFNALSAANVLTTTSAFLATLTLSIGVYRLSPWHPLAHIPGPTLAKISKWWSVRLVLSGEQHRVFKALHDQYGDFVRVGPNEVSVIHVEAIKSVFGTGGFPKGQYYEPRVDPVHGTRSLLTSRGDAHANRRRIWNRGMSSESLRDFELILEKRLRQLLEHFDKFASTKSEIDMAAWFSYLMFDFMGDMAFGGGFEMLRDGKDNEGYWTLIKDGAKTIAVLSQLPWLAPALYKIPMLTRNTKRLRRFGAACAVNRAKSGPKLNKDLWFHLMDEEGHEKKRPTMADVIGDGVLAIIAGSDTSSVALSSFIWCLLSNPDVFARVQAEVDAVYPDPDSVFDSLKHGELRYLTACFNEALRLFPPVPTGGPRQIPPGAVGVVAGKIIPENTQVYVPAYAVHRNPRHFFPNPDKFDPDRWLRGGSSNEVLDHLAFIPFSYGAANCVGKGLAWREMLMVASALLKRYELRFGAGMEENGSWVDALDDAFVTSVGGKLLVQLSPRA
ncbi:hypothetical protein MIND_01096500 [Mycena indigotica]|uniref:Cytochrome P450 n=1 Tax=Mycena indigotica TaxID=2126181 RepID=A0A8H6S9P1_9AGAR|nr:uncharacterized protein MIND_01096500 [Mycena indigotica]KAF7295565.1 hypothetical protein MIND_01096500 [Mycena indigotica]